MRARAAIAPGLCALWLAACGGSEPPATNDGAVGTVWLSEEARERGLAFTWESGHAQRRFSPEIMGGGAALFDLEGDGDLDAYLVQAGSIVAPPEKRPGNQLFANDGSGRFVDESAGSGADDRGYGMGVAAGDADGDGRTDLYVTNVGPNALLVNDGDGTFTDRTEPAGVGDPGWSTSTAFVDYDEDGDLDLYVANYVIWSVATERVCYSQPHPEDYCAPAAYDAPEPDTLYRNAGDGTFRDVSVESGIHATRGNGLGVVCGDYGADGWTDIFVANDGSLNHLWKNGGDGTFTDVAVAVGVAVDREGRKKAGMGTHAADLDFDGDEDLLVVNLTGESDSYFRNDGTHFSDRTPLVGLASASRSYTRFGAGFIDLDQDGWLDLFEANGRVTRHPDHTGERFDEPSLVFRGTPAGKFEEVLPRGGTRETLSAVSRAAAFGDVDGDGALDILVVNRDAPAYLLMNRVPGRGGWIAFHVREASGRDALGAILRTEAVGRALRRTVRSAYSYCAANDPRVHLGLGTSAEPIAEVVITWVDGVETRFAGPFAAGRVHELRRPADASSTGR